jgi:hypothetical protein
MLFSRLDLDAESIIELNYERKEIVDMKKIVSPYPAGLGSKGEENVRNMKKC